MQKLILQNLFLNYKNKIFRKLSNKKNNYIIFKILNIKNSYNNRIYKKNKDYKKNKNYKKNKKILQLKIF